MSDDADQPFAQFVLVETKLSVPAPRGPLVARPGLIEILERGRSARLTLVCAPTGWGKTSLIAEWAASDERVGFCWVSLDHGDDEPLRFWRYLVAAIATVEPTAAHSAERRLRGPVVSISDEVLPVLVNDLTRIASELVLVLDDFHVLERPEIATELGYLLDRLPRHVHVVVATQIDPRLRLGRLRALGELAELRGEQLRFNDEEAEALLNDVHGLKLGPEEILTVQRRTEGWVAGLNLAALSLKQAERPGHVLEEPSGDERFVFDYLWEEVVLAQSPEIRRFLTRTAILDRLTGPLCDAVVEGTDSAEVLRDLERANLFVVALDPGGEWFRYHHLFRALLLGQLRRHAPDLIDDLHRRASAWCADHGLMAEAIDHAITAGDVHWAADELDRHWLALYSSGQAMTLLDWIDRMPSEAIDAHPMLALVRGGVARAAGRLDEAEEWLDRAERAPGDAPAHGMASSLAGAVAMTRSMYRLAVGDVPGAIGWGRRAVALEPVKGSQERATASFFLAASLFYSNLQGAQPLLAEFLDVVPAGEQDVRRYFAMALLAEAHALDGRLQTAQALARQALEVTRANGLEEHPPTNQVHIALGAVQIAAGELDSAEEHLERGITLARRGGEQLEHAHALAWMARLRGRRGDPDGAREALDMARRLVPGLGGSIMPWLLEVDEPALDGERHPTGASSQLGESLTAAELRVLRLLPGDLTYREIATHTYVSLNTVRSHAQRIRRKLGASSRAESVAKARERGLL